MNWFYADAGQQAGPVDEARLAELVRSGKVQPETLVWREGMPNWLPYREVAPALALAMAAPPVVSAPPMTGLPPGPNQVVCAECNGLFNVEDTIAFGNRRVCAHCKPVFMQKLAEGVKLETRELRYAGFWIRCAAKLIDGIAVVIVFIIPLVVLMFGAISSGNADALIAFQLLLNLGVLVVNFGYQTFLVGKYGATLGKMACGLRVVTGEGDRFGYGKAAGRALAEILSGMICDIGYLIAAFDNPQKRALHDHICNTRVVYK